MNIYFLGTCAGTEPMPCRKHASVAVESGEHIYWFDAGEGCSYTAHLLGINLLKISKIVISHTHMDHIGGLGNLLWNIRKLSLVKNNLPVYGAVEVFLPNMESWEGIMILLRNTEGNFKTSYPVLGSEVKSGVLFDDGIMRVTAFSNTHLASSNSEKDLSFSYLIECEGKKLVYSGDVGKYTDLDELLSNGCDGLILETGHFGIDEAYDYCRKKDIGKLFFSHNGREILNDLTAAQRKVQTLFGAQAMICEDGMGVIL